VAFLGGEYLVVIPDDGAVQYGGNLNYSQNPKNTKSTAIPNPSPSRENALEVKFRSLFFVQYRMVS
jgi:hypothetical protein